LLYFCLNVRYYSYWFECDQKEKGRDKIITGGVIKMAEYKEVGKRGLAWLYS
jgi:hypothetical protein